MIATYTASTAVWHIALCIVVHTGLVEELIILVFRVEYTKMEAMGPFRLLVII
jgi:hypothetical protein